MLGAAEQGIPRIEHRVAKIRRGAERSLQNLRRGICVGSVQRQSLPDPSLQLNFGAVSQRLLHIEKLAQARLIGCKLNLIMEEIIEVGCVQGPATRQQVLLETGFKGSSSFRQQAGIRDVIRSTGKNLIEGGLHEPGGIGKSQTRSRQKLPTVQRQQS